MRHHGLGALLDRPKIGQCFRKSLAGIVLATDMSVHFDFMSSFRHLANGKDFPLDYQRLLLCQAIIKCADISNPVRASISLCRSRLNLVQSRPPGVSHYWANALMSEWTSQASLEKHWHLPLTVQPSASPLVQVQGQIFFISTFAMPLMDVTALLVPGKCNKMTARSTAHFNAEMRQFADQCTANLVSWQTEEAALIGSCDRAAIRPSSFPFPSPRPPQDFLGSFPLTLPTFALDHADEPQPTLLPPSSPSYLSSSSSSVDGHSDGHRADLSPPDSPVPFVGSGSFVLTSNRSSSSLRTMSCLDKNDATVAMRAAYQAGVRKKRSFYNRYSWTSDLGLNPNASSPNLAMPKAPAVLAANAVNAVKGTPRVVGTVQ